MRGHVCSTCEGLLNITYAAVNKPAAPTAPPIVRRTFFVFVFIVLCESSFGYLNPRCKGTIYFCYHQIVCIEFLYVLYYSSLL